MEHRPPATATQKVNREEIRMLVAHYGYEETSRQTGIKAGTLRQWSKRYHWKAPIPHIQETVTTVTKPSDILARTLQERKNKSALHLSKYVLDASKEAKRSNGNLKLAQDVRHVAATRAHLWPEQKQEQPAVLVNIGLLGIDPRSVSVSEPASVNHSALPDSEG